MSTHAPGAERLITRSVRSLPLKDWPEVDRLGWEAACKPGQRLSRGGTASHLAPVTQADLANRYGLYLDFLDRSGRLDLTARPTALVTAEAIAAFVAELQDRVSSVTVSRTIYKVRRAAECIAPGCDFAWLAEIGKDLVLLERPKDKFDRLVLTERLVEAGLTLFKEADADSNGLPLGRALLARNGLMVALLAPCPVRLRNFAALEIGRTFLKIDAAWWIVLPDTKSGRPDHRPVPPFLPFPPRLPLRSPAVPHRVHRALPRSLPANPASPVDSRTRAAWSGGRATSRANDDRSPDQHHCRLVDQSPRRFPVLRLGGAYRH